MSRIAYVTLAVLFSANFINFVDRQVIAVLAPILKDYWHLTDAQVGLLGTAFEVTYALGHVPLALLSDRWWRRKMIALAMTLWSGAMALLGSAASYAALLLGRALLGVGESGYGPSALAWLSDVYPPDRRSRAVGFHDLGVMLGSAAGYALGGVLGKALGWRPVFYVAALPGFALAALVWCLPEPRKGASDCRALGIRLNALPASSLDIVKVASQPVNVPTLLVVYGVGALCSFATAGLVYWLPSFAVRVHGFGGDTVGLLLGAITVVTGAAGVLSGAFLADWLLSRTRGGRLLTIGLSAVGGFPLALAAILAGNRTLFVILAALAMYAFAFYLPCIGPLIHQVARPGLRATAMAFYLLVIHASGYATAPAIIGWLSDQTGELRMSLLLGPLMALMGGVVALWGTRFVGEDERAMRAHLSVVAEG